MAVLEWPKSQNTVFSGSSGVPSICADDLFPV